MNSRKSGKSKQSVTIDVETIRLHLSSLTARIMSRVSLDTIRPLHMFLGINQAQGLCLSVEAFTPPIRKLDKSSPEKIKSRVQLNFAFFLSNYVLVAAMVALVVALMHPSMLLFVAMVYGLWSFHSFLIRHELEFFGIQVHSLLSIQQRFYLLFVITTIVVVFHCLMPALFFLLISSLLIISHALLRDPKHIESDSFMSILQEGSREDAENDVEGNYDDNNSSPRGSGEMEAVLVERPSSTGPSNRRR